MAVYSDISLSFSKHPVTNDVGKITDVNAITNSMRNILTTRLERDLLRNQIMVVGFMILFLNW